MNKKETDSIAVVAKDKAGFTSFIYHVDISEIDKYFFAKSIEDLQGKVIKDICLTQSFFSIENYKKAKEVDSIVDAVLNRIKDNDRIKDVNEVRTKFHHVKCIQPYYDECKFMNKNFEFRKNDRNYKVGDWIVLHEYDKKEEKYVTRNEEGIKYFQTEFSSEFECLAGKIIYILDQHEGIKDGYCVLGIQWSIPNLEAKGLKSLFLNKK